MNRRSNILFFILELISGIGVGILGTYLVTPNNPKFDLNLSIIIGFLTICAFALIGIAIPGFFHSRIINGKYWLGIINTFLFLIIGLLFGVVLSFVTFDFLPYRFTSFYIPIFTPILIGVIGFNVGIKTQLEIKSEKKIKGIE